MVAKRSNLKVGVLGAGSWGGTLAYTIGSKGIDVSIWTVSKSEYNEITKTKSLIRPKKLKLPKTVSISTNLKEVCEKSDVIIIAVPTKFFDSVCKSIKKLKLGNKKIYLSATKGITQTDCKSPSMMLKKHFSRNKHAVLSGPNIALDVLSKTPIITVVASKDKKTRLILQELISTENFRVYLNSDVIGVEMAGALKNVIAIASGMSDGFGFSISSKSALISRGLIEIARIGIREGGKLDTMYSAAGIGDLIATCCSPNSRNYRVGFALGRGKKLKTILKELGEVAEGAETAKAMLKLARKHKIDAPIAKGIYDIVVMNKSPKIALQKLLKRPLPENELSF